MRLKINKACDLNSISVLPPHSRRANASSSGVDSSGLRTIQPSQFRSQSQQSQSQGMSLSQLSQSSFDEVLNNEQRLGSQDQLSKRISCLAPITSSREESQMQLTRSSNNIIRRWSSASASEQRCQVNEELEHRIGLMETTLSRLGRVLDSVQNDVMQINKAVKEVTLETEGIRQKMMVQDNSLQLILKGEEDIKARLDRSLKCIPEQLNRESDQNKLHEIASVLLALPGQIEARISRLQTEVCWICTKEMKEIAKSWKLPNNNQQFHAQLNMNKSCITTQVQKNQPVQNLVFVPPETDHRRNDLVLKKEKENPKTYKSLSFIEKRCMFEPKQEVIPLTEQEQVFRVLIESDEEMDVGFSCLLKEKGTGGAIHLSEETNEETMRILRKARRRKRKLNDIITID